MLQNFPLHIGPLQYLANTAGHTASDLLCYTPHPYDSE